MRTRRAMMILAVSLCLAPLQASDIHPRAGTTSAAFLKYDAGSRASAMAGAFTAVADDVTALYWNPAGLPQITRRELNVTHNESFEGIRHDFCGYVLPLHNGVLAGALYGLYTPKDIERRLGLNENDPYEPLSPVEGYFQSYDLAAHVAYGRRWNDRLSIGAGLKAVRQTIDTTSGNGIAADIGALYRWPGRPLTLALMLQHAGTPIKFTGKSYALPFTAKAGAAYRWTPRFVTALDLIQPIDNFLSIAAGAEYLPAGPLALRAGYKYRTHGQEIEDGLSGFTAGLGFTFRMHDIDLRVDYAFVPFSTLGNSHRLSLTILFDAAAAAVSRAVSIPGSARKAGTAASRPALPAEPPSVPRPQDILSRYAFSPAKFSGKIRSAAGRTTIFAVRADAEAGDLVSIEGLMRGPVSEEMKIEFGEMQGKDNDYKSFLVTRNFSAPIQKLKGTVRLPAVLKAPRLVTKSGRTVEMIQERSDNDRIYYSFSMETLEPFRITGQMP